MTKPNPFLWPKGAKLTFCDARGKIYFESRDRKLDLSDSLMRTKSYRTVYLGITAPSQKSESWTEEKIASIEDLIRYDLQFDGYRVTILRLESPSADRPCWDQFRWKLTIRPC